MARTVILTFPDNGMAETFAKQVREPRQPHGWIYVPEGTTVDGIIDLDEEAYNGAHAATDHQG